MVKRIYVNCFSVDPSYAEGFKFPRVKGGFFTVNYMECAFKKEMEWGEIFIEFEDQVDEDKLVQLLEGDGALQITTQTFPRGDGNYAAAGALMHIHSQCENGWTPFTRGVCPPALLKKVQERQEEARVAKMDQSAGKKDKESNDLNAALAESLKDTGRKVDSLAGGMEGIGSGVCELKTGVDEIKDVLISKQAVLEHNIELEKFKANSSRGKLSWQTREYNDLNAKYGVALGKLADYEKCKMENDDYHNLWKEIGTVRSIIAGQNEVATRNETMISQLIAIASQYQTMLAEERAAKPARAD